MALFAWKEDTTIETRTGFLISQIKQVQGRVFQRLLASCGVEEFNGPQGHILYVLWQGDGVPIATLVQKTGLAKNTLTAMLARMDEAGLITRRPSETDRRQVLISLTDKARGLEERYEQVSQQMNRLFYRGMGQEDARVLDGLLARILANLEDCEKELKLTGKHQHKDDKGDKLHGKSKGKSG